ncbi:D-fructose 1,6-bisphosphatase [Halomicrobium zhouii]|uniref:Fructose-1,6-bisphosphatase class 1 n=1 Tax=Halomicrobium zhouii TaxID=767519 RepID=A0A1I6LDP2_9EURY|nr:class 1 fructose-bisphosphatase [Halomicrobium zhouii]SFS01378.1 D-fructose 1,6-bisphosphatase [Halomicrobium zhouii]
MNGSLDVSSDETNSTVDAVVETIAETAPEVRTAIAEYRQYTADSNATGDQQLAADVRADELFEERLLAIDGVASYASEEREDVVTQDRDDVATDEGDLHVAMDPLDGSSNLKPNSGMGTIFGVYETQPPTVGRDLVAAGYVIYGPVTSMVVARDGSVTEYLLHDGESRVVDDDVTISDDPTVYGFGGGEPSWTDAFTEFADDVREELKLRYGGAMIADISQVLTYGGIFAYPALRDAPEGKLRLQFEGQPMGYVVETAGGRSSNGEQSLLDVEPDELHERTPLYVGNSDLVDRLEAALD